MDAETLATELERIRHDLHGYLRRLLVSADAADDVFQTTALRALGSLASGPETRDEARPWLFRIATNLAIDELRRRERWTPGVLIESRAKAEDDRQFVEMSAALRGSPQMKLIAREHLAACFACTLRTLTPERSAALLLREVYGFSNEEIASILEARRAQVKNWLQEARQTMESRYEGLCALVHKKGICYQCAELADFFNGAEENPLKGTPDHLSARLRILEELRRTPENPWHRRLFSVFDQLD